MACGVRFAGTVLKRTRLRPSAYVWMMSTSFSLYAPASQISPRHSQWSRLMVASVRGGLRFGGGVKVHRISPGRCVGDNTLITTLTQELIPLLPRNRHRAPGPFPWQDA